MSPTIVQLEKYYQENLGYNGEAYHVAYWAGIAAYAHLESENIKAHLEELERNEKTEGGES